MRGRRRQRQAARQALRIPRGRRGRAEQRRGQEAGKPITTPNKNTPKNEPKNTTGRLGATQLAGVGVALSVYATASKLLQVPLLSIATTTVAAAKGAALRAAAAAGGGGSSEKSSSGSGSGGDKSSSSGSSGSAADAAVSSAASAALAVAAAVGVGVGALLFAAGPALVAAWGAGPGSPLRRPALDFLALRALGAPVSVVLLVAQGCFRGLQDTATPLRATLAVNALNVGARHVGAWGGREEKRWGAQRAPCRVQEITGFHTRQHQPSTPPPQCCHVCVCVCVFFVQRSTTSSSSSSAGASRARRSRRCWRR